MRGWIYTDNVVPYCTNMDKTPVGDLESVSELREINLPRLPGARFRWNRAGIADAAKAQGLETVYYCDWKTFSVLGGIWKNESVVVYGE